MTTASPSPLVQTFMTHRMSDEAITMLATGREEETRRIMNAVERSLKAAPGALQHLVIHGPRGFGKSFMARLVQIETGKLAAARGLSVPFVLLPEEQHNLTRSPHALPAYIAHRLADLRTGEDHSWTGAMFQWPDPEKAAAQWDEATAALERELDVSFAGGGGMAIVVIENFDLLLFNVFKEDAVEQRLRKWLDRPGNRLMLIATATGSVDMDYDRPLFQAFEPIRLDPWDQDTCIAYFNRRRQAEAKPLLDAAMEAKARAVADFIGGNPRLAQLLADVLDTQDALSVADTMKALADKLSDYYRRRIDDLPPLAQGLLDALIRGGEPSSQTELAKRVGAPGQSTIARVMQDLQHTDIIRGLPAADSRETLYRVTDRVFVHFYRLRQGNQLALQTPLATILEFLRAFYSREEQKLQAARHLDAGRHAEGRLFADLARERGPSEIRLNSYRLDFARRLRKYFLATGEASPFPLDDLLQEMDLCPEQAIGRVEAWTSASPVLQALGAIVVAQAYARLGLTERADERLARQLRKGGNPAAFVLLHYERGALSWARGDRPGTMHEAASAGDLAAAELPYSLRMLALRRRAWVLGQSKLYDEALATAREAASLAAQAGDPGDQAIALGLAARLLNQLGKHGEALTEALLGFHLAHSASDEWSMGSTAIQALFAAIHHPAPDAVDIFSQWVEWDLRRAGDGKRPFDWRLRVGQGLAAAARALSWDAWDRLMAFLAGQKETRLADFPAIDMTAVGEAIARRAQSAGRAEGFEAARGALPRLARLWELAGTKEVFRNFGLAQLATVLARESRDPGLLRDVAGLLTREFAPEAPRQASLLSALAQIDEAPSPEAVLARMDPDVALWLRRIRDLPEPRERAARRRKKQDG